MATDTTRKKRSQGTRSTSKKTSNKSKKKQESIKDTRATEIRGIFLVAFGLLGVFAMHTNSVGEFGIFIRKIIYGTFSTPGILIPYITIGYGIINFNKELYEKRHKLAISAMLLFTSYLVLYTLIWQKYIPTSLLDFPQSFYQSAIGQAGGGIIGNFITFILLRVFGTKGSFILICAFTLLSIILFTNMSVLDVYSLIKTVVLKIGAYIGNFARQSKSEIKKDRVKKQSRSPKTINTPIRDSNNDREEKIKILDYTTKSQGIEHDGIEIQLPPKEPQLRIEDLKKDIQQMNKQAPKKEVLKDSEIEKVNIVNNEIKKYVKPSIDLLDVPDSSNSGDNKQEILAKAKILEETLNNFGVEAKVIQISKGPTITRYELQPSPGVKVSKIVNLSDDIALNLAASNIRIEAPIPGKSAVGIEVPNDKSTMVNIREVIESPEFKRSMSKLSFVLGQDISGLPIVDDLTKMPHMLVAGATGSGKSVCINTLITSILYNSDPSEVKFLLIDPKVVELNIYNGIPHLLLPVVTDPKKAAGALNWAVTEMNNRYKMFAENSVRDIDSYNKKYIDDKEAQLPKIVIIIDELADLMMVAPNQVEDTICRLAQMARAAGLHLIVATQRPSVDVITGVIKANIPSRIAFAVSSQADSRTILDMGGAEKLLGKGDMLFYPVGTSKPKRMQGAFVSDAEVKRVIEFIKEQGTAVHNPDLIEEISEVKTSVNEEVDELLTTAIELVVGAETASISMLQRKLRVGYNRAARLIDEMEARGIVSEHLGSKPRKVLISKEDYESEMTS